MLPLADDGSLDYGLLQSMKALDGYYSAGEEHRKENNPEGDNSEGWVETDTTGTEDVH